MPEPPCPKRHLAAVSFFFAFICLISSPALDVQSQSAQASGQTNASQSADVTEALRTNFGPVVETVAAFRPFYVTGDFNGDGAEDIVVVVRIKGRRRDLPKDVRVINPFEVRGAIKFPANPATENKLALVIIHGWKIALPMEKFLLIGEAPILILEYERARSSRAEDRKGLIELLSKRGRRRKGQKLPPGSKGDVIILGSEVGDSVLYWNGKTYLWEDSPDD